MSGRRSKGASASVSTPPIADSSDVWTDESKLFKPVDKKRPDSEWPIFQLDDAIVLDRNGEFVVNLLLVERRGPFVFRGRLNDLKGDKYRAALINPTDVPSTIYLEGRAYRMSIGWGHDTDGPNLWAASEYGFFSIRKPALAYEDVYKRMVDGITLYYTVMDIYEEEKESHKKRGAKKSRKRLDLNDVLLKYAVALGDGSVIEDVVQRCTEQAPFLASHCRKDNDFDWQSTKFYSWVELMEQNPALLRSFPGPTIPGTAALPGSRLPIAQPKSRSSPPGKKTQGLTPDPSSMRRPVTRKNDLKSSSTQHNSSDTEELGRRGSPPGSGLASSIDGDVKQSRIRRAERMQSAAHSKPTASDASLSTRAHSPPEVVQALFNAVPKDATKTISLKGMSHELYRRYRFKTYHAGREALEYYAKELVDMMDADNDRQEFWLSTQLYPDLKAASRRSKPTLEHLKVEQIPDSVQRRNPAGRRAAPQGKLLQTTAEIDAALEELDEDAEESMTLGTKGRHFGKAAGLRLASGSKKRPASIGEPSSRASKASRPHYSPYSGGEGDEDADMEGAEAAESTENDGVDELPGIEPVRLVIRSEKLPSTEPRGPNGSWMCDQEDCGYVVHAADGEEGQATVRQHIYEHEDVMEKIDLAVSESRGHLPISHLLAKLKHIGEKVQAEQETKQVDGPQPIRRRLLV